MRIFDVIKIDMKKICQFIVNNKQALAVKILLIKSKPFHLSKLTSVLQNILIRQNHYHIDIVSIFIDRYICAAMQE